MKSIHHHHPPPLSTLSNFNHHHHHAPAGMVSQRLNFNLPLNPKRTKAMAITTSHLVVLGVNPPPATTGDLSVLIPTSAGFLFLYWIANFVVPEFVIKDLQSKDGSEDQNTND